MQENLCKNGGVGGKAQREPSLTWQGEADRCDIIQDPEGRSRGCFLKLRK